MQQRIITGTLLTITLVLSVSFFTLCGTKSETFHGDALGYYVYLPATFIYHNHQSLNSLPKDKGIKKYFFESLTAMDEQKTPKGYTQNQYTYGVALMELPFFFIAHGYEIATGRQANGFSDSYRYLIKVSSLLYGILGLILAYKIVRRYFSETASVAGICLLFAGTNLFWFMLYQAGMSHVPLFFLYALLIYLTIRVHERPRLFYFIMTGAVAGLITIIRPTDIICLLIPLLYNVYDKVGIKDKIRFVVEHKRKVYLAAVSFIVPIIPQLIYWKIVAGSFVYYSYGSQTFTWSHPHIIEGLFHFRNGWLPYSPIMIFSIAGMFLYKSINKWAWTTWVIFPGYVYIIYSWYCYNYINGLGSRPMIHLYPLLAISLVGFIQFIFKRGTAIKVIFSIICVYFVAINISYSMQKHLGILRSEESNYTFNMQMQFRMKMEYNDLVVFDLAERQPDTTKIIKTATLASNYYEDSLDEHYEIDGSHRGTKRLYHMSANEEWADGVAVYYNKQQFGDAKWIKCSGKFMCPVFPNSNNHQLVLQIGEKQWKHCTIENKIGVNDIMNDTVTFYHLRIEDWGTVYYFVRIPKNLHDGDKLNLYVWNPGKQHIYIDDVCMELYKER